MILTQTNFSYSLTRLLFACCLLVVSCERNGAIGDVIETSKLGLEKARETQERIKGKIESFKKEKEKIDREVEAENAQYRRDVEADAAQAEVYITVEKDHLRCRMRPTQGRFKILEQGPRTAITWFVNGVRVSRPHKECGSGRASLGVGLGGKGRSCESIGGPHDRQGLYPYQVPKGSPDDAEFVCRLSFPKTVNHIWKELLSVDLDSLVNVRSKPIKWPHWRTLRE